MTAGTSHVNPKNGTSKMRLNRVQGRGGVLTASKSHDHRPAGYARMQTSAAVNAVQSCEDNTMLYLNLDFAPPGDEPVISILPNPNNHPGMNNLNSNLANGNNNNNYIEKAESSKILPFPCASFKPLSGNSDPFLSPPSTPFDELLSDDLCLEGYMTPPPSAASSNASSPAPFSESEEEQEEEQESEEEEDEDDNTSQLSDSDSPPSSPLSLSPRQIEFQTPKEGLMDAGSHISSFSSFSLESLKRLFSIGSSDLSDERLYKICIERLISYYDQSILTALDNNGFGIIHHVVALGFSELLDFFLRCEHKSCLHLLDYYGNNSLLTAIQHSRSKLIIPTLISQGVNFLHENKAGQNGLKMACDSGNGQILSLLLQHCAVKAIINERDKEGKTLLHYACAAGNAEIVELLVKHGGNPSVKDNLGSSCLTTAVTLDHASFLDCLLEERSILDSFDRLGRTPLHWAAAVGNLSAVKTLVNLGAKLEARDRKGRTPFLLAAFSNHIPVLQFLMTKKANNNVEDYEGRTHNCVGFM